MFGFLFFCFCFLLLLFLLFCSFRLLFFFFSFFFLSVFFFFLVFIFIFLCCIVVLEFVCFFRAFFNCCYCKCHQSCAHLEALFITHFVISILNLFFSLICFFRTIDFFLLIFSFPGWFLFFSCVFSHFCKRLVPPAGWMVCWLVFRSIGPSRICQNRAYPTLSCLFTFIVFQSFIHLFI